jgi:DNA sulfur modification protein DndD
LGLIYRELSKALPDNKHLNILHQDDINYKGINQEHHSFDEYNFNFIHSRTSHEVQNIFDAVSGLDEDIRFLKSHITILNNLIQFYKKGCERIKTLNSNMPLNIQNGIIDKHNDAINQLKDFPEQMAKLKISESEIKEAEEKINKVLIGILLSSLLTHIK